MSNKPKNPRRRCRICGGRCEKQMRFCKLCARTIKEDRERRQFISPIGGRAESAEAPKSKGETLATQQGGQLMPTTLITLPCIARQLEDALHAHCDHHGAWDATITTEMDEHYKDILVIYTKGENDEG